MKKFLTSKPNNFMSHPFLATQELISETDIVMTEYGAGEVIKIEKWQEGEMLCCKFFVKVPHFGTVALSASELALIESRAT